MEIEKNEDDAILLGRINRAVEKALSISLASDVHVYCLNSDLDKLASAYPTRYLAIIEQLREAVFKHPDFAYFEEKTRTFYLAELYFQKGRFVPVIAKIVPEGKPSRWCFKEILPSDASLSSFAFQKVLK